MARTNARDRTLARRALGAERRALGGFRGAEARIHDLLPVLPVAIVNEHRDRRSDRLTRAHPGEKLDRVLLDLHATPAAVALLSSRELDVHIVRDERQARGNAFENADQSRTVGFAGCREADHAERNWLCRCAGSVSREHNSTSRHAVKAGVFCWLSPD